jgi:hypothetical protein
MRRAASAAWTATLTPMFLQIEGIAIGKPGQGWAFGTGLDRITMLKYGIPDLRDMFNADLRWLRHYGFSAFDVPTLAGGLGGEKVSGRNNALRCHRIFPTACARTNPCNIGLSGLTALTVGGAIDTPSPTLPR